MRPVLSSDALLLETVNGWLQRTGVTLINIESIYDYGQTGIAITEGFSGVRVWFLYEAKEPVQISQDS